MSHQIWILSSTFIFVCRYTTLVAQQVSDPQQAMVDATSDFCIFAAAVLFAFAVSARTTLWPDGAEAHSDSGSMLQDIDSDDEDGASPDSGQCASLLCSLNECDCERVHSDESNSEQLQFAAVATSMSAMAASVPASARRPSGVELRDRESSVGSGSGSGSGDNESHGALSVPLAPSGDARPPLSAADPPDRKPYFWSRWNDRITAFFDTYPGSGQLLAFAPAYLLFCHQNMFIYFLADIDINSSMFSRAGSSALAMATVIAMMVAVLAFAAYFLRVLCRRPRRIQCCFAASYGLLVLVFAILMAIFAPDFSLHLHHAFLPLVLLPLTRARKDPIALIALGILCGMLTNGIACWGWAPNFASDGAATSSSARLPAPRLVGNLTSSSLALAMERLPSASALSAYASFPIVSLVAPAVLLIPAAKWNSLLAASRAPSVDISISADGERRAVLLGHTMNHASDPERQSPVTFAAVTRIDSAPPTRGDDNDPQDVDTFVSLSRLIRAPADLTSIAEFSAVPISLHSIQTTAISSANVATAQITVLPNMVLLMNGVRFVILLCLNIQLRLVFGISIN